MGAQNVYFIAIKREAVEEVEGPDDDIPTIPVGSAAGYRVDAPQRAEGS